MLLSKFNRSGFYRSSIARPDSTGRKTSLPFRKHLLGLGILACSGMVQAYPTTIAYLDDSNPGKTGCFSGEDPTSHCAGSVYTRATLANWVTLGNDTGADLPLTNSGRSGDLLVVNNINQTDSDQRGIHLLFVGTSNATLDGTPITSPHFISDVQTRHVFSFEYDSTQYSYEIIKLSSTEISIGPVTNANPVITEGDSQALSVQEDAAAQTLSLNATDTDTSDTLTWSISTPANKGTATVSASPTGNSQQISYRPNADENGDDSFVVTVDDGNGGSDTLTVNVTISPVADAPRIEAISDTSTDEDQPFNLTLNGSDPDGDTLNWRLDDNSPSWLSIDDAAGNGAEVTTLFANGDFVPLSAVVNSLGDAFLVARDGDGFSSLFSISASGFQTEIPLTNFSGDHINLAIGPDDTIYAVIGNDVIYTLDKSIGSLSVHSYVNDASIREIQIAEDGTIYAFAYDEKEASYLIVSIDDNGNLTESFLDNTDISNYFVSGLALNSSNQVFITVDLTLHRVDATGANSVTAVKLDQVNDINDLAFDKAGNFYNVGFAPVVKQYSSFDDASVIAGSENEEGDTDGKGADARFRLNKNITFGNDGFLYVIDEDNNSLRKLSLAAGTSLTGTPTNDDVGEHNVCVIANDGDNQSGLDSNQACFKLSVNNVNDAPSISGSPDGSVDQDQSYRFTPAANDIDANETLTFSIDNKPSWAQFDSATGTLSGTPGNADVGGQSNIIISVSDGEASAQLNAFSITVNNVNDAPSISGTPNSSVVINQPYSFTPNAADIDSDIANSTEMLSFSIANKPSWASFNNTTGELSGTPTSLNTHRDITISVTDSGQLSASLPAFNITVDPDMDGDGIGDSVDSDIDGDGIDNTYETANNLNPRDASDALLDNDGDGVNNLDEFNAGTDSQADDYPPTITLLEDEVSIDATALLTLLPGDLASASDALDGPVSISHNLDSELLAPGKHTITWKARDAAGNEATLDQTLNVRPLANWQVDQQSAEGNSLTVTLHLNGEAPDYPVVANYSVTGSAENPSDHNAQSGTLRIESGTEASISVDIASDNISENDENIVFTLDSISNAVVGEKPEHEVVISEFNHAPSVTLSASKAGDEQAFTLFASNAGTVIIRADVEDVDLGDDHSFVWSADSNLAGSEEGGMFSFDPAVAGAGSYQVSVTATDDAADAKSGSALITLTIVDELPTLGVEDSDGDGVSDQNEGAGDSDGDNVPDFADSTDARNLLAIYPLGGEPVEGAWFVESEAGLQLELNVFGSGGGKYSPLVADEDLVDNQQVDQSDAGYAFDSGIFDFVVSNIPVQGESVNVVIPQVNAIPEDAVYRKELNGAWFDFVEDANNVIRSAPGERGVCPPPGSDAFQPGLTAGHYCVQLTIEDGGPNDADGQADGNIVDPGGVGVALPSSITSSGGAGSAGFSLIGLIASLSGLAFLRRKAQSNKPKHTSVKEA